MYLSSNFLKAPFLMTKAEKKYRRFHHLWAKEVEGEFFIVDDTLGKIHSLSQASSAVWRLLEQPQTKKECLKVFKDAFPNADMTNLEKLVTGTIAEMERGGLIY